MRAGGACLLACVLLLLPAAMFTCMAAASLLLSFTVLTLVVRHGFQPHTLPRSSGPPGPLAALCRHMVRCPTAGAALVGQMPMHVPGLGLERTDGGVVKGLNHGLITLGGHVAEDAGNCGTAGDGACGGAAAGGARAERAAGPLRARAGLPGRLCLLRPALAVSARSTTHVPSATWGDAICVTACRTHIVRRVDASVLQIPCLQPSAGPSC